MTTQLDSDKADLQALVIKSLETVLRKELADATAETKLFEELGLDSTSVLELLMMLEDEHGIEVDPESLTPDNLETVGAVCVFIKESGIKASGSGTQA